MSMTVRTMTPIITHEKTPMANKNKT